MAPSNIAAVIASGERAASLLAFRNARFRVGVVVTGGAACLIERGAVGVGGSGTERSGKKCKCGEVRARKGPHDSKVAHNFFQRSAPARARVLLILTESPPRRTALRASRRSRDPCYFAPGSSGLEPPRKSCFPSGNTTEPPLTLFSPLLAW